MLFRSRQIAGLMIDLDGMKSINDQFGHQAGDQALIQTARILQVSFRKGDFIARYGGDEFVVILTVEDPDGLDKAVRRLESNLLQFNETGQSPFPLSLSIGAGVYDPAADQTIDAFIGRLDKTMYYVKYNARSAAPEVNPSG